jgi:formate dehydrogenase subunit gamma
MRPSADHVALRGHRAERHKATERVQRFDRTERSVHWATAGLVLTLVATGAVLYVPALSVAVGRRLLVEDTHVYVGLAVFVPLLAGLAGRWGRALRADLHAVTGMNQSELSWLRTLGRQGRPSVGKFNPGQKLNTNALGGLIGVLFFTGIILRWGNFLPVAVRTGATFVHDVFAFALLGLVAGHIAMALTHPQALRSMITGWVTRTWARHHAPAWLGDGPRPSGRRPGPHH